MLKQDRIEDRALSETIIKNSYSAEDTYQTVFSQGFGAGLGIEEPINSPTFTIVQVYDEGRLPFYHFDVYRIADEDELFEIGFEEMTDGDGVSLIEWANLIPGSLPEHYTEILIEKELEQGFDYRKVSITGR